MASIWLPLGRPLYGIPKDEREELINRLFRINVYLPGARTMEIEELRDLVQWQEERAVEDARKALWRPAHQKKKHSRAEVEIALREYFDRVIIPRREGRKFQYGGVTVSQ